MIRTDIEGERGWKSKTRPQSTMALQFSADLDSIFGLQKPSTRDVALEEKRKSLDNRSAELAELQARLRAMETRLKNVQAQDAPVAQVSAKEDSSTTIDKTAPMVESRAHNLVVRSRQPQWTPRISVQNSGETLEQENDRYTKDKEIEVSMDEGIEDSQVYRNQGSRETLVKSN